MNRCMSLEECLERFFDENTQPADEEITLIIPHAQAETLGLFSSMDSSATLRALLPRSNIDTGFLISPGSTWTCREA